MGVTGGAAEGAPVRLTGGCQCGAVRYEVEVASTAAYYCHCRMCQKAFGNVFAAFFQAAKDAVRWTAGRPALFDSSRLASRGFCAACGTPLSFAYHDKPRMDLSVGSLDEPGRLHPVEHSGVESRVASFFTPDGLPETRTEDSADFVRRWREAYGSGQDGGRQGGKGQG